MQFWVAWHWKSFLANNIIYSTEEPLKNACAEFGWISANGSGVENF